MKKIIVASCMLSMCLFQSTFCMYERKKYQKQTQEITLSYKREVNDNNETLIQAYVNNIAMIGRIRYQGNSIKNLFIMKEYVDYNNGEIKKTLITQSLKDMQNAGYTSAFTFADRDASFYQNEFGAVFTTSTHYEKPHAFKLNPTEDFSGEMEIKLCGMFFR